MKVNGQLKNAQIEIVDTVPTNESGCKAQMIFVRDENKMYVHNGTEWVCSVCPRVFQGVPDVDGVCRGELAYNDLSDNYWLWNGSDWEPINCPRVITPGFGQSSKPTGNPPCVGETVVYSQLGNLSHWVHTGNGNWEKITKLPTFQVFGPSQTISGTNTTATRISQTVTDYLLHGGTIANSSYTAPCDGVIEVDFHSDVFFNSSGTDDRKVYVGQFFVNGTAVPTAATTANGEFTADTTHEQHHHNSIQIQVSAGDVIDYRIRMAATSGTAGTVLSPRMYGKYIEVTSS